MPNTSTWYIFIVDSTCNIGSVLKTRDSSGRYVNYLPPAPFSLPMNINFLTKVETVQWKNSLTEFLNIFYIFSESFNLFCSVVMFQLNRINPNFNRK